MNGSAHHRPEDYYKAAREGLAVLNALFDGGGLEVKPPAAACIGVITYYTARTIRGYAAVLTLCEQGFGVEAQAVVRGMLEDVVDTRYISTDPTVLAEEWVRHESRARYYAIKRLRDADKKPDLPDDYAELQEVVKQDKVRARELAGEGANSRQVGNFRLKKKWTLVSLSDRAKAAQKKWDDTLDTFEFYDYLCNHTHGSAALAGDYVAKQGGYMVAALEQGGYKSVTPLMLAAYYASLTFGALHSMGMVEDPEVMDVLGGSLGGFREMDDLQRRFVTEQDSRSARGFLGVAGVPTAEK